MPSYNYLCRRCRQETIFNLTPSQEISEADLLCDTCRIKLELIEYSEKEDLQGKKVIAEIQGLQLRIQKMAKAVSQIRERIEHLEDTHLDEILKIGNSLIN